MNEAPQNVVEYMTQRIVETFHPRRIVLFGSRARGDAREDSDYDLFVEMESDKRPAQRAIEISSIFGIRLWTLDVFVYTPEEVSRLSGTIGTLLYAIQQEGRVLYEQ